MTYYRIHTADIAYITQQPRGLFTAIGKLVDAKTLTEEELNAFCMGLPRYKRPRKIIFAVVPRNPTGKIEKPKLREMYGGKGLVEAQNLG